MVVADRFGCRIFGCSGFLRGKELFGIEEWAAE
jgi:hypothetical protein